MSDPIFCLKALILYSANIHFLLVCSFVLIVELYAGAGGMSIGLDKCFDLKWIVDNDHLALATLKANKTGSNTLIYTEDVKTFLKESLQGNNNYPSVGEVDHIHASPPCKGFSRANRNGGKNDMINNNVSLFKICS